MGYVDISRLHGRADGRREFYGSIGGVGGLQIGILAPFLSDWTQHEVSRRFGCALYDNNSEIYCAPKRLKGVGISQKRKGDADVITHSFELKTSKLFRSHRSLAGKADTTRESSFFANAAAKSPDRNVVAKNPLTYRALPNAHVPSDPSRCFNPSEQSTNSALRRPRQSILD